MPTFQYKAYSKHPEVNAYSETLLDELVATYQRKPNEKRQKTLRKWMKVAVAGLYLAGCYKRNTVQITRSRGLYYGKSQRSPMHHPELLKIFEWLIEAGYLNKVKEAHQADGVHWVPATYELSRKWIDVCCLVSPVTAKNEAIIRSITRNPAAPAVELRQDGKRLPLKSHPEKSIWNARVKAYNNRLTKHEFRLNRELLAPVLLSITRIFSDGSYSKGGRYYSNFQQFKSQLRLFTTIDGEPVAEIDYKSLHPSLLYQRAGMTESKEDAYTIAGYPRKLVKKAFNILINRKKPAPATQSLVYFLNKDREVREAAQQPINAAYCEALEAAIRNHHKDIEHYFCSGVGLELQHHDSQLCSHILDYFLIKTDSIVLTVHDSFICKQSELPILAEAIKYAENTVARAMNTVFREPLLEAEVIKASEGFEQLLDNAFGSSISSNITEEDAINSYLHQELPEIGDIYVDVDADEDVIGAE